MSLMLVVGNLLIEFQNESGGMNMVRDKVVQTDERTDANRGGLDEDD